MSAKNKTALTAEVISLITSQSTPESINPASVGQLAQDIIDSMYDSVDTALYPLPISMTKGALATSIGASLLNDKQWVQITDRTDTFPLFVLCQGVNKISPFGIWVKAGKPLAVTMDYTGGYDGENNPFITLVDENRMLSINGTGAINKIYHGYAVLNYNTAGAITAGGIRDFTINVPGAVVDDVVILGANWQAVPATASHFIAFVSGVDTVTVRYVNCSGVSETPPGGAGGFRVTILKYY